MLHLRLQRHQVDDIDHPHLEVRQMLADEVGGGQCLQGGDVPGARHHHVRLAGVVAGPVPDPDAAGAMHDGVVHR